MKVIYETSGRAREYFELAANLYTGCEYACRYCFGATVTHKDPKEFFGKPRPRDGVLRQLQKDAARLPSNEIRHILLSFVTDPYQPLEEELKITRRAILILHAEVLSVAILTKGGLRATRDFDLLNEADLFGVTLVFEDEATRAIWEPYAAPTEERITTLRMAKERGISTWASFEPVFSPDETLSLIARSAAVIDVFKVGTLNYREEGKMINWKRFAQDAVKLLDGLGANYYIKKDLARYIGKPEGITKGYVPT